MSSDLNPIRTEQLHVERFPGDPEGIVVAVSGELDLTSAPQLARALREVEDEAVSPVVVDLVGLTFVDSSGLHVLLSALRRMTRLGRPMPLVVVRGGQVHRLLELTRLLDTFCLHHDRAAALAERRVGGLAPDPGFAPESGR